MRSATQSILIAPGNVAGVIEQNVLIGFDDHQIRVVEMLGQPIGRDQALGVGVALELLGGVGGDRQNGSFFSIS